MKAKIGVFEGDFIGPEVIREGIKVLSAISNKYDFEIEIVNLEASGSAYDKYKSHMPPHTVRMAEQCDALIKAPFGGPTDKVNDEKWASVEKDGIMFLREHFNLYTNLRQIKVSYSLKNLSPIKEHIIEGVDILIVRELVSGIYFGEKAEKVVDGQRVYSDNMVYSESEIRRIAIKAFELAKGRSKKVTLVAKSNILKNSVLWREVVDEVAKDFPDVTSDYMHVDNASMQLIINPKQFDVILTSNLFGDILSDEASSLAGSIGLFASASLGEGSFGLYEPIHGSAPEIASKNIANPISLILSVAQMFRYSFSKDEYACEIEQAVEEYLNQGYRTKDIYAKYDDSKKLLGTSQAGDKIVEIIMDM